MKSTGSMIVTAMFTAVTAVLAQISVPLPSGVPVTLQTFAAALAGVVLGAQARDPFHLCLYSAGRGRRSRLFRLQRRPGRDRRQNRRLSLGLPVPFVLRGSGNAAEGAGSLSCRSKDGLCGLLPRPHRPFPLSCAGNGAVCLSWKYGLSAGGGSGVRSLSGQGCLLPCACISPGRAGSQAALPGFFSAKARTREKEASLTRSNSENGCHRFARTAVFLS